MTDWCQRRESNPIVNPHEPSDDDRLSASHGRSAITALIHDLLASGLHDLSGAHVTGRIPLSQMLLNRLAAEGLRRSHSRVRQVEVHPKAENQFDVFVKIGKWRLVPAVKIAATIEQQPEPASPVLVLRWSALGGLGAIAASVLDAGAALPPGIQLDGDRLRIDVAVLTRQAGAGALLPYLRRLHVTTEEGRVVIDVELGVG
jgi:hypothetical protein